MLCLKSIIEFTLLLIIARVDTSFSQRRPRPFPRSAIYSATLKTNKYSKLCAECTFHGTNHFFDTEQNRGYVSWWFGKTANDEGNQDGFSNFKDVFFGDDQKMFLIMDSKSQDRSADCAIIEHQPSVFNQSWSHGAKYEGIVWFTPQVLAHRFTNVYPYFVQGEIYPSEYYEAVEYPYQPLGYKNHVCEMWYGNMIQNATIKAEQFEFVNEMGCKPPEQNDWEVKKSDNIEIVLI